MKLVPVIPSEPGKDDEANTKAFRKVFSEV